MNLSKGSSFDSKRHQQNEVIRPETFVMASLMANGRKISLAPTVLGYVYHGLGQIASHPDHPGHANPCFSIHYVVGWLAETFSALYSQQPDLSAQQIILH